MSLNEIDPFNPTILELKPINPSNLFNNKQTTNTMKHLKHMTIAFVLFFMADIAVGQGIIFFSYYL